MIYHKPVSTLLILSLTSPYQRIKKFKKGLHFAISHDNLYLIHLVVQVFFFSQICNCHTRLHLGCSAELRIWQVQLARWSHKVVLFPERTNPTRPDPTTQLSFSFNVVRCPKPIYSPHQQSMCGAPPSPP